MRPFLAICLLLLAVTVADAQVFRNRITKDCANGQCLPEAKTFVSLPATRPDFTLHKAPAFQAQVSYPQAQAAPVAAARPLRGLVSRFFKGRCR